MNLATFLSRADLLYLLTFIVFALRGAKTALIYLLLFEGILAINTLIKLSYHQPRPFMVDVVEPVEACPRGFGTPSGHALMQMGITLYFSLNYSRNNLIRRCLLIALSVIYSVYIGVSRVYVKVHSFDQILLGWTMGGWAATYYYNCLQEPISEHLK